MGQIITFEKGVPVVNALVLDSLSANIAINHILLKTNSLDYISIIDSMGLTATSLQLTFKCDTFSVITHRPLCHSRSFKVTNFGTN